MGGFADTPCPHLHACITSGSLRAGQAGFGDHEASIVGLRNMSSRTIRPPTNLWRKLPPSNRSAECRTGSCGQHVLQRQTACCGRTGSGIDLTNAMPRSAYVVMLHQRAYVPQHMLSARGGCQTLSHPRAKVRAEKRRGIEPSRCAVGMAASFPFCVLAAAGLVNYGSLRHGILTAC